MKTQYRPYPPSPEPDYKKALDDVLGRPQTYQIAGLPLQIASLLGGTSRQDLLQMEPETQRNVANYNPAQTRRRVIDEIELFQAQHYLWNTLRVVGAATANRFLKEGVLTEEGVTYVRAMQFPVDDLHTVRPVDRKKLKEDLAKAVGIAYEMLQTQPPTSSKRQKVRSKR